MKFFFSFHSNLIESVNVEWTARLGWEKVQRRKFVAKAAQIANQIMRKKQVHLTILHTLPMMFNWYWFDELSITKPAELLNLINCRIETTLKWNL